MNGKTSTQRNKKRKKEEKNGNRKSLRFIGDKCRRRERERERAGDKKKTK